MPARGQHIRAARARHGRRGSAPCATAFRACSVYGTRSLHLPAGMDGGDSAREIAILHLAEAGFPDQSHERPLRGKPSDALGQIAVRGTIARHDLAKSGQHRKGIEIIEPIEPRSRHARKFETEETPAWPQHAIGFATHV